MSFLRYVCITDFIYFTVFYFPLSRALAQLHCLFEISQTNGSSLVGGWWQIDVLALLNRFTHRMATVNKLTLNSNVSKHTFSVNFHRLFCIHFASNNIFIYFVAAICLYSVEYKQDEFVKAKLFGRSTLKNGETIKNITVNAKFSVSQVIS